MTRRRVRNSLVEVLLYIASAVTLGPSSGRTSDYASHSHLKTVSLSVAS
jgi:hypothetical protein